MKISQIFFACIFSLFVIWLYQSCVPTEVVSPPDPTQGESPALLQIFLTDDPADYDQVNIDLQEVWVKIKDSTDLYLLQTNQGIYDLLQLQNGLDTLIATDSLPPGEALELRLVLGQDNSIMVDSTLHELKVPSAQQSGLKIKLQQILVQDSLSSVTIDFDAGKSVVEQGNGGFLLKPVIRVLE